jgi:pimeloyl-ACP methyl ester carboxylesterase
MRTTLLSTAAATLLIAITLLSPGREAAARSNILWRACHDGFECGTMDVPLDHSKPGGGDIEIALIRAPALDQEHKIGSLLVNFGGPGGPGVEGVLNAVYFFPQELQERFDIIGFDPRGVGQSTAVDCIDSFGVFTDIDSTPDTPLEIDHAIASARDFGEDCQRRSGELIQFVNSEAAARDMDLIREELGDEKLSYVGFSYGTFLGATYAEFFPDRVRALVLDGGMNPAETPEGDVVGQAKGFELALHSFLSDCAARPACPFKAPDLEAAYDQLLAETDVTPLDGWDFPIGRDDILSATAGALYNREDTWVLLGEALRQAVEERSGVGFGALLSGPDTGDEDVDFTNGYEAFIAIACVDFWSFSGEQQYRSILAAAKAAAPRFGALIGNDSLPCVFWPGAERRTPRVYTAAGAPPILVVGTLRDPATPYEWSVGLAGGLESGVLLTYDGDGHTASGKNACADGYTVNYLVNLVVPPAGITCANEYEPPAPPVVVDDGNPSPPPPTGTIRPPDTGYGATPEGSSEGIALAVLMLVSAGGGLALLGRRIR